MWHASISSYVLGFPELEKLALAVLSRVGSAADGEWASLADHGVRRTVHLRRRLSSREASRIGPIRDLRGTAEEMTRAQNVELSNGIPWQTLILTH